MRRPIVMLMWPLRSSSVPLRLQVSSAYALWNSTSSPSSLASAAVITTSDRQLPARAANACDALRVYEASYSSFSSPRVYSASTRPLGRPCLRISGQERCR